MIIKPLIGYVRELLTHVLEEGDIAVDGTVGNGHDTLFLARLVGETGRVHGFDVQEAALANARARLAEGGAADRAVLHLAGHERMRDVLPADVIGKVKAVTFNFGYLPGGDKELATTASTTLPALQAALDVLAVGGVVTAMLYSGHPQGRIETEAVLDWAQGLDQKQVHVLLYRFWNQRNDPPILLALEKRS